MTHKKYALEVQTELKTIATELLQGWCNIDCSQFGWDIELTEENTIENEIWFGNNYVIDTISEPDGWVRLLVKSLISTTSFEPVREGAREVEVTVDLPDEYGLPKKTFRCEYEFVEGQPMKGFPDAIYEAYLYFREVTDFSYAEKLSYLAGALWQLAHTHDFLNGYDHQEVLGWFVKEDIVD